MVYRFNQAPTAGYERYTGVKTTHESLNSAWVKALVDTAEEGGSGLAKGNAWRWRKPDTSLVLFEMFDVAGTLQKTKEQNAKKDRWWKNNFATLRSRWPNKEVLPYNPLFVAWAYRKYGDLSRFMAGRQLSGGEADERVCRPSAAGGVSRPIKEPLFPQEQN